MFFSGVERDDDPRHWFDADVMVAFELPESKLGDPFDSDIFLDSGAFSLRKYAIQDPSYYRSSKFRDYIDQYAAFVKRHGVKLYANVDVIGDPKLTLRNQRYLEQKHGLRPIPVVHFRTPIEWVRRYADEGYEFIGFGGLASDAGEGGTDEKRIWLERAFAEIDPMKTLVHGFGVGNPAQMLCYPWWSVDCTTWVKSGGMGMVLVPPKKAGQFRFDRSPLKLTCRHYCSLKPKLREVIHEWLDLIEVEVGEPGGESGILNKRYDRVRANAIYLKRLVDSIGDYPHVQARLVSRGFDLI